jgi:hypothetical protein
MSTLKRIMKLTLAITLAFLLAGSFGAGRAAAKPIDGGKSADVQSGDRAEASDSRDTWSTTSSRQIRAISGRRTPRSRCRLMHLRSSCSTRSSAAILGWVEGGRGRAR